MLDFLRKAMTQYPESELVLNSDGSVYHLNLLPSDIADVIITVGDPERVPKVSQYFDSIEVVKQKREFHTHTGKVGKQRVTVISSGIGPDNVEILMNELDALVNINLLARQDNPTHRSLKFIRIGTCGSLQEDLPTDSFLMSTAAIGLDNLMNYYQLHQTTDEQHLCMAIAQHLGLPQVPYCVEGSTSVLDPNALSRALGSPLHLGNTLTCPGFYAPQGRALRGKLVFDNWVNALNTFRYQTTRLDNFEMETASYYAFSRIFGHEFVSLNAVLANRINHQFSSQSERQIDTLIRAVIEQVESIQ